MAFCKTVRQLHHKNDLIDKEKLRKKLVSKHGKCIILNWLNSKRLQVRLHDFVIIAFCFTRH